MAQKKHKAISHYEFCKAIALALIDPEAYWPNCMHKKPVHNKHEPSVSESDGSKQGRDSVDTSGTRSIKKFGPQQ